MNLLKGENDSYTLTKDYLGGGAFGSVWKGLSSTGNTVAIKQILFQNNVPNFLSMIESEVKLLEKVSKYPECSPYIVCFYDFIKTAENMCYIVMELLDGKSLEDTKVSEDSIIKIFLNVSQGVQQLHNAGILHRDIKPDNIMVTKQGAKLVDLGVGCVIIPIKNISDCSGMAGTISFIDPRAFLQVINSAEKASDIFSLGMTFLEVLYGNMPKYIGKSEEEMRNTYQEYANKRLSNLKGPKYLTEMLLDMANPIEAKKRPSIGTIVEALKTGKYSGEPIPPPPKLDPEQLFLNAAIGYMKGDQEDEFTLRTPEEYAAVAKEALRRKGIVIPDETIRKLLPKIKI